MGIISGLNKQIRKTKTWIKHRTNDRYDIVKTDLPYGYHDVDTRMLHANFSLLVDFIEEELFSVICFMSPRLENLYKTGTLDKEGVVASFLNSRKESLNSVELYKNFLLDDDEVLFLYHWWTVTRKERDKISEKDPDEFYNEDTEMLVRLMKVRRALWT